MVEIKLLIFMYDWYRLVVILLKPIEPCLGNSNFLLDIEILKLWLTLIDCTRVQLRFYILVVEFCLESNKIEIRRKTRPLFVGLAGFSVRLLGCCCFVFHCVVGRI